jgi:outer membrane protein TolC
MMKNILIVLCATIAIAVNAQEKVVKFTLEDVMRIAREQSPDALVAKNRFRSNYWQYRSFRAAYLPGLQFDGRTSIVRSISTNVQNGVVNYYPDKTNEYTGALSLKQNIGFTGGKISVNSGLRRTDQFVLDNNSKPIPVKYGANPVVNIQFDQPLSGYNSMKWDRKIQPLVFEEAKRNYLEATEQLHIKAITRFFDLMQAQLNLRISKINYNNSDTLYKISQGRYNIGTIAQNDLLQMQLSFLNAKASLTRAEIELENQKARLRSFLGYNEKLDFELVLPDSIPALQIEATKITELALKNNPDIVSWKRRLLEANRDVAQAKGQRQTINLSSNFGLSKNSEKDWKPLYDNPGQSKNLYFTVGIPIIDWGQAKGRVKMAQSNRELVNVQLKQEQVDFEQNISLQVMQFNLQNEQVAVAAKADTIAQFRYDVTKQRFLIGKIDVLNLNDALKEKDNSKRSYISALFDFWNGLYNLRMLTQYDIVKDQPLDADFEQLIQ